MSKGKRLTRLERIYKRYASLTKEPPIDLDVLENNLFAKKILRMVKQQSLAKQLFNLPPLSSVYNVDSPCPMTDDYNVPIFVLPSVTGTGEQDE
jgi:hypothetical protein